MQTLKSNVFSMICRPFKVGTFFVNSLWIDSNVTTLDSWCDCLGGSVCAQFRRVIMDDADEENNISDVAADVDISLIGSLSTASWALVAVLALGALLLLRDWHRLARRRQRACCVPLRVEPGGRLSVCLISSRKHPERWTFPAGGVERGERHAEAALRETREEAGLTGRLGSRICEVADDKSITLVFALHVEAELPTWDEMHERERRWFSLGAPGTPSARPAFAAVRELLVKKKTTNQIFDECERSSRALQQESEQHEVTWGPPPAHRQRRAVVKH